jgi:C1A family cysteine protease
MNVMGNINLKKEFKGYCEDCKRKIEELDEIFFCDECAKWVCPDCFKNTHRKHSDKNDYIVDKGKLNKLEPRQIVTRASKNDIMGTNAMGAKKPRRLNFKNFKALSRIIPNEERAEEEKISIEDGLTQGNALQQGDIKTFLENILKTQLESLPVKADYRNYCSPAKNQGNLNSSAAIAVTGVVEFLQKQFYDKYIETSPLFLYKVSRNLLHLTGNENILPRTAVGALLLFGVPPEEYWPYTSKFGAEPNGFDREPPAFCYAFARNYKSKMFTRLDTPGITPEELLDRIKTAIGYEIPPIISFDVYDSIYQNIEEGLIPYPQKDEEIEDYDHSVVIV